VRRKLPPRIELARVSRPATGISDPECGTSQNTISQSAHLTVAKGKGERRKRERERERDREPRAWNDIIV